jgi:hypothetical protein
VFFSLDKKIIELESKNIIKSKNMTYNKNKIKFWTLYKYTIQINEFNSKILHTTSGKMTIVSSGSCKSLFIQSQTKQFKL